MNDGFDKISTPDLNIGRSDDVRMESIMQQTKTTKVAKLEQEAKLLSEKIKKEKLDAFSRFGEELSKIMNISVDEIPNTKKACKELILSYLENIRTDVNQDNVEKQVFDEPMFAVQNETQEKAFDVSGEHGEDDSKTGDVSRTIESN